MSLEMLDISHRLITKTIMSKSLTMHKESKIFTINQIFFLISIKIIDKFPKYNVPLSHGTIIRTQSNNKLFFFKKKN